MPLREALEREGGGVGRGPPARHRRAGRLARGARALRALRAQRARAADPRPLRQPRRRGRARPVLALAAARGRSSAGSTRCPGATREPRRARRCAAALMYTVGPGQRGRDVPGVDDLLGDPRAARGARPGRRVGAAADRAGLRRHGALAGMAMTEKQGGSDVRANTTTRRAAGRRHLRDHRPQVVLLLPPVRRVPDARPGARRACPASCSRASDPGFRVQRLKDKLGTRSLPSSEVEFHGVRGRLVGEEGRGVPDDHPHGQPHPAGLPDRLGGRRCAGAPSRPSTTPATARAFGKPAGGAARDAERAGRPGARVGGRHRHRDARSRAPTTRTTPRSGASPPR